MSFSAEWLALREPLDHASRNAGLARTVTARFAPRDHLRVVDLGCGTGSNLRATMPLLPPRQDWLLVDHDAALLAAARLALHDWADRATTDGEGLVLHKGTRAARVHFRRADLTTDLDAVLGGRPDLVTASALFDLISPVWIEAFARKVRAVGAAFYTVLTYNGADAFAPAHPFDGAVIAAFARHQKSDKGFGIAAGPDGAAVLAQAFHRAGFAVVEAESPWRIAAAQTPLAGALLTGIAAAVGETGQVPAAELAGWLDFRLGALASPDAVIITGHRDTLAVPA